MSQDADSDCENCNNFKKKNDEHCEVDHLNMKGLIKESIASFKEFVHSQSSIHNKFPTTLLKHAKGIVFLTTIKSSFGFGALIGTGIILIRNDSQFDKWTGPIAIALVGLQIGFNIGIQKTHNILVLQDSRSIQAFLSKGHLRLGADVSMAVGPSGRDCNLSIALNEKGVLSSIISYSMAKGAYIGWSFEGQIITLRNDCNEEYYKQKITPQMILNGSLPSPNNKEFEELCVLLDKYIEMDDDEISTDIDAKSWILNRETKRAQM